MDWASLSFGLGALFCLGLGYLKRVPGCRGAALRLAAGCFAHR